MKYTVEMVRLMGNTFGDLIANTDLQTFSFAGWPRIAFISPRYLHGVYGSMAKDTFMVPS